MRVIWEEELHYTKQNVILQLPYCFILGLFMLFRKCFIHVCNPIDVIIPTMQLSYDVFNITRMTLYIQLKYGLLYNVI
jgi:hypothetical protein